MKLLVLKLNATGDVVRTTTLLRGLRGEVTWVTAARNVELVKGVVEELRCLAWEQRDLALDSEYDLVINLEDDEAVAEFVAAVKFRKLFGAFLTKERTVAYSDDSREWFDMSLVSRHGRQRADALKLLNRRSYQEIIFQGLNWRFEGQRYLLPKPRATDLRGDVAIAPLSGPMWPMKNWAYYDRLANELVAMGLQVNVLPVRESVLEHLGDVANHRCLVSGDSLPMHLALGAGIRSVALFTCTSPWEIYGYGLMTKIVSPLLEEFFYKRGSDPRATTAITVDEVLGAVVQQLQATDRQEHLLDCSK